MKKDTNEYINSVSADDQGFVLGDTPEADDQEVEINTEEEVFFSVSAEEEDSDLGNSFISQKSKFSFFKKKAFIIPSAAVALLLVVCIVFSMLFRNGTLAMPAFIADTGIFQGDDFRFFDGITINGIDVSGLSLTKAKSVVENAAKESNKNRTLAVETENGTFELSAVDFTYEIKDLTALDEAKAYCISVMRGETEKTKMDFQVEVDIAETSIEKMREKAAAVTKEPVAATFTGVKDGKPQFSNEENGSQVDEEELLKAVKDFLFSSETKATVKVKLKVVVPEITKAVLEEKIVKLSTYTTVSTNSANGNHNMNKAVTMCSGSIIKPGEVWSFNACTGNSNLESGGWKKATVYIGGRLDTGVGGGLCQASTTIYHAALLANMGIVERHNHRWLVGYARTGFDATIDYPGLDLKLKNNTEYPVYIEGYMVGKNLTVNFYGYQSDEYDEIKLSSYETSRVPGQYYTVSATRSLWKDGKLVRTENLVGSKYSLETQTWASDSTSASDSSQSNEPSQSEEPSHSEEPSQSEGEEPSQSEEEEPSQSEEEEPSQSEEEEPSQSDGGELTLE